MKTLFFNFSEQRPMAQLLILALLIVIGALFSLLFSYAVGVIIWGAAVLNSSSMINEMMQPDQIAFLKFSQVCSQLGMLLFPALFFSYGQSVTSCNYLKMKNSGGWFSIVISIFVVFAITPFVAMLTEWNATMKLPECLGKIESMMKMMEDQANALTQIFIEAENLGGLLLNICIMALLPAFAEECLFRGVVQNIFQKWIKNSVWAIIITAIIFSGFHFQFYGFFPRMILGIVLGALYTISGSLWVPITAHFVNNATAVVVGYLEYNGIISTTVGEFGQTDQPLWIIVSIIVVLGLFWLLKRYNGCFERKSC